MNPLRTQPLRARQTTRRHALCTLAVATALAATSLSTQAQLFGRRKPEPVVVNQDGPLPAAAELFNFGGDSSPAPKRIVIPSFTVEFATMHGVTASQSSGIGTARQTTELILQGLDATQLQKVTDAAYLAFLEEAKAAGFEVVSKEELLANPVYQAARADGKPSGLERDGAGMKATAYAPSNMVINGIGLMFAAAEAGSSGLGALGGILSAARAVGDTASAVSSMGKMAELSPSLGGARLVQVRLVLYFAEQEGEFGKYGQVSAGVKSKLALHVDTKTTQIAVTGADGRSIKGMSLKQPFVIQGDAFAGTEDISPTAANVGVAVLGAMVGSSSSSRTSRFNVMVKPTAYSELASTGLRRTAALVFAALKAQQ